MVFGLVMLLGMRGAPIAPVDDLVERVAEYADRYRADLPSLECDESITSRRVKGGKVKHEVRVEGVFRVTRTGPADEPFVEGHRFKWVDGKPAPPKFSFPFFLSGAFANGVGFSRERMKCFVTREEAAGKPDEAVLIRESKPGPVQPGCEQMIAGAIDRIVVDRASGRIVHVEMTNPVAMAKKFKQPYFALIDYAPVTIGEREYWLPSRVATHDDKDEGRFEVRYSNFHRYGATFTIVHGIDKVPEP